MPSNNSVLKFKYGLSTKFTSITPDANSIYFLTDTQQLFVGDAEYTRPVQHGTTLPTGFAPANSLFYKTDTKELYYSEDGTKWTACSNFYSHPTFTAKTVGNQASSDIEAGGSFKVPKITINAQGHVSAAEDITITLPSDVKNTVTVSGDGNAVTGASYDTAGHALTLTKGTTFATKTEVETAQSAAEAAQTTANSKVTANKAITGATHTKITYDSKGLVTGGSDLTANDIPNLAAGKITSGQFDVARIPNITLSKVTDSGAAAAKGVATSISTGTDLPTAGAVKSYVDSAINGVSQFKYQVVTELPTASKDTMGSIYLVAHAHTTGDGYDEYLTIESGNTTKTYAWEKIGNTDIDLTAYAKSADVSEEISSAVSTHVTNNHKSLTVGTKTYNGSAAVTIAKGDLGLGNVDNTSDANKPVSTAQKTAIADAKKAGTDAQSTIDTHAADTDIHITAAERTKWNGKQDALVFNTTYNASTNKVATMADVTSAALVWEQF